MPAAEKLLCPGCLMVTSPCVSLTVAVKSGARLPELNGFKSMTTRTATTASTMMEAMMIRVGLAFFPAPTFAIAELEGSELDIISLLPGQHKIEEDKLTLVIITFDFVLTIFSDN